jgi:hypothetical protein
MQLTVGTLIPYSGRRGTESAPQPRWMRSDPERASLLKTPTSEAAFVQFLTRKYTLERRMCFMCSLVLLLLAGLVIALALTLMSVNTSLNGLQSAVGPHAEELVEIAMRTANSTGLAIGHVQHATAQGDDLATKSVPQMLKTVNATATIAARLQKLMEHPSLKLSLED